MDPKLDIVFARRSIRQYTDELLTEDEIQALLEAGMAAPSGRNIRPWHMITVTDKVTLAVLAKAHPYAKMAAHAAAAIVVCGDPTASPNLWVQDCSAATENILIAAAALGLGAVWVACCPHEDRQAVVRTALGIPDEIGVLCLIPVGRPAEHKPARTQYESSHDHRERW